MGGGSGVSKSQASRLCEEIDARVKAFLDRPLEGDGGPSRNQGTQENPAAPSRITPPA
jgi:hypothetical protein